MALQSIKFLASFPKKDSYGLLQVNEVEFKLGLGPCGKHVHNLRYEVSDHLLTIIQRSTVPGDSKWFKSVEIKTFIYKLSDIHGRIETIK